MKTKLQNYLVYNKNIFALLITIFINLLYLLYQVNLFISNSGKLYGVDVSSYLITAEAIINHNIRGINFLYSFPLFPIIIAPFQLLPLSHYATYILILYSGLLMMALIWFPYGFLLYYLINESSTISTYSYITIIFLLTTFRPFLEQYAWGGFSQFLGYVFGIMAITYFIKINTNHTGRHNSSLSNILPEFLLSLSITSEAYSGVYWLLIIVLLIFIHPNEINRIEKLKLAIKIVSISILFSLFLYLPINFLLGISIFGESTVTVLNAFYIPNIITDFFIFLFDLSNFASPKWILSVLILTLLIIALLVKYKIGNKTVSSSNTYLNSLSISMWISLLAFFLITPAFYTDRFLHFLIFPLCIELLQLLILTETILYKHKTIFKCLIILFILIISLGSLLHIQEYLNFYSFPSEYISSIDGIKLEPGNSLSLGIQPFIASFITKQNVYPVFQPVWFTRKQQVKSAIIGKLIYSNYYIINLPDTYLSFSDTGSNIIIHKYLPPYFLDFIKFAPLIIEYEYNNETFFISEGGCVPDEITRGDNYVKFRYILKSTDTYYEKVITILRNSINVVYVFNLPVKKIYMLSFTSEAPFQYNFIETNQSTALLKMIVKYREPWYQVSEDASIQINTINANINIINTTNLIKVHPTKDPVIIKVKIRLQNKNLEASLPIRITTAHDLIQKYEIKYLLVSSKITGNIPHHINKKIIYKNNFITVYMIQTNATNNAGGGI